MAVNPYLTNKNVTSNITTPASSTGLGTTQTAVPNANSAGVRPVNTPAPAPKKGNAYQQQYKEQSVMTMTQGEMLLKLYAEVIKQLQFAVVYIDDQEDSDGSEEDSVDKLAIVEAARKLAEQELRAKIERQLKENGEEVTKEIVDKEVTKEAIEDVLKKTGVTGNNGGKAKNSHNNALVEKRNEALQKVQKILNHLRMTLNFDYEISNNLNDLYEFFSKRIIEANIKNESKPLKDILPLVQDLYDAYTQAEINIKSGNK